MLKVVNLFYINNTLRMLEGNWKKMGIYSKINLPNICIERDAKKFFRLVTVITRWKLKSEGKKKKGASKSESIFTYTLKFTCYNHNL